MVSATASSWASSKLEINRKVLADIAMNDPAAFKAIFDSVMKG
jgi:ribosomal protein L20